MPLYRLFLSNHPLNDNLFLLTPILKNGYILTQNETDGSVFANKRQKNCNI